MLDRRDFLVRSALTGAAFAVGCGQGREAEWCLDEGGPEWNDDGPFPGEGECRATAAQIEGPFYRPDAPERTDIVEEADEGTVVTLAGRVLEAGCAAAIAGAVVEVWQADPKGAYDNASSQMRYRCRITTDADGAWSLRTLLPGRYLNGSTLRPRHLHVKVLVDGVERLTTQLYFEGDPYLVCDPFANTSLVVPFSGTEGTALDGAVDLVL